MSEPRQVIVTVRHLRQAKACASGTITFLRRYGLDHRRFFRDGLPAEDWEATGDAMAIRIAALAREDAARRAQAPGGVLARGPHLRLAGACGTGAIAFLKRHGIDHRRFFREGVPVEQLERIDDPVDGALARRVAAAARQEAR